MKRNFEVTIWFKDKTYCIRAKNQQEAERMAYQRIKKLTPERLINKKETDTREY